MCCIQSSLGKRFKTMKTTICERSWSSGHGAGVACMFLWLSTFLCLQADVYRNIHVDYNRQLAELMYTEMANTDLDKYYKVLIYFQAPLFTCHCCLLYMYWSRQRYLSFTWGLGKQRRNCALAHFDTIFQEAVFKFLSYWAYVQAKGVNAMVGLHRASSL